jgi:hypothetical protein
MIRSLLSVVLTAVAAFGVSALAVAEDTVIEHRMESEHHAVEAAPAVKERVVEERTVTKEAPVVHKRTDTVVTSGNDNDDNDNDDNDNDDND